MCSTGNAPTGVQYWLAISSQSLNYTMGEVVATRKRADTPFVRCGTADCRQTGREEVCASVAEMSWRLWVGAGCLDCALSRFGERFPASMKRQGRVIVVYTPFVWVRSSRGRFSISRGLESGRAGASDSKLASPRSLFGSVRPFCSTSAGRLPLICCTL